MSDPEAAILKLPDELLLDIANNVDVVGLHGLALTCRRIRPIAQEALVRNGTLTPIKIWMLIDTLQTHPELAMALSHLRLGPITKEQAISMMETSEAHKTQAYHSSCCDIISRLYPHTDKTAHKIIHSQPDDFYTAGVLVLIALAKGLIAISTSTNSIDTVPMMRTFFNNDNAFVSCWHRQAKSQLEDRLQELNVTDPWLGRDREARTWPPATFMNLSRFRQLKRLVVPSQYISLVQNDTTLPIYDGYYTQSNPCLLLPKSVELIQLTRIDAYFSVAWLSKLMGCVNIFPKLRKIEMHFDYNMMSTAWYIRASNQGGKRFLTLLQELKASNALFTTAFCDVKFADEAQLKILPTSEDHITGDLVPALEKCLATTHDDLEKDAEMLAALGYTARSSG
jgi:hypothetical protein